MISPAMLTPSILEEARAILPDVGDTLPPPLDLIRASTVDETGGPIVILELVNIERQTFRCAIDARHAHELSDQLLMASAKARRGAP